jgi:hypothetical protein
MVHKMIVHAVGFLPYTLFPYTSYPHTYCRLRTSNEHIPSCLSLPNEVIELTRQDYFTNIRI